MARRRRTGSVGATIDIYERDPQMRELMQDWLRQAGYRVREHAGSRDQSNRPVDLVILATLVPTQQALGLIRTMRVIYPTTAFLVLSSHSECKPPSARVGAPRTGATRVLSKPLGREELLEAVRAVIGNSSPATAAVYYR
jgi:DNA-binding response OmpR family regulator